ncbi:MAG: FAD-dependent oxidoreductase [Sphingobacteriales bacterium]|nr:MAG: FAD-dependent oxidoreductase [Sphingobacteriales bacterium]
MEKISIWNGTGKTGHQFPPLIGNKNTGTVIIGGGITGVMTAYFLAQKGVETILVEALDIAGGTTSHSTGNLYCMVDEKLQKVRSKFDADKAHKVAQSRQATVDYIEQLVNQHNIACDFIRAPFYLYAFDEKDNSVIEKEYEATTEAGISATLLDNMPNLPYKTGKALEVPNQAQFHPLKFVQGMANIASLMGVQIYERTKMLKYKHEKDAYIVHTENGSVTAKNIVLATHMPKGFLPVQTLVYPYREYGVAAKLLNPLPAGIYWGITEDPKKYSVRPYTHNGENYVMVIGENHKTGHKEDNLENISKLEKFLYEKFDVDEIAYRWGGQHYKSADSIPFIGKSDIGDGLYYATGLATDGLTYGSLAAMILADEISGTKNPWSDVYDPKRFTPMASAKEFLKENADVAAQYLKDLPFKFDAKELDEVKTGEGKVLSVEGKRCAAYRDENNELHVVSAICPHMMCVVHWNKGEKSWDCPCHGSRFTFDGRVIEGPAISDLEKLQ